MVFSTTGVVHTNEVTWLGMRKSVSQVDGWCLKISDLLPTMWDVEGHHPLSLLGHFLWDLDRERVRKGG